MKRRIARLTRKNADDKLRKLERQAASGEPADIAAYWRACLKAGKIPEATTYIQDDEIEYKIPVWTLFPKQYVSTKARKDLPPRILGYNEYVVADPNIDISLYEYIEPIASSGPGRVTTSFEFKHRELPLALQKLIDVWDVERARWENPIRKNADDRLRRLERAAASQDPESLISYWRACIKANVKPNYTVVIPALHESDSQINTWTLWPREYEHYFRVDQPWFMLPPRVIINTGQYGASQPRLLYGSGVYHVAWQSGLEQLIGQYESGERYAPPM